MLKSFPKQDLKKKLKTLWMKYLKYPARILLLIDEIARFFIVFLIFVNPVLAVLLSFLFDYLDAPLAYLSQVMSRRTFYILDKIMDYWFYVFILISSFTLPIFPIVLVLFLYRTIGQLLTIFTYNEIYLVIFFNLLDIFFLAYFLTGRSDISLLILLLPVALAREYEIHFRPVTLKYRVLSQYQKWKEKTN